MWAESVHVTSWSLSIGPHMGLYSHSLNVAPMHSCIGFNTYTLIHRSVLYIHLHWLEHTLWICNPALAHITVVYLSQCASIHTQLVLLQALPCMSTMLIMQSTLKMNTQKPTTSELCMDTHTMYVDAAFPSRVNHHISPFTQELHYSINRLVCSTQGFVPAS